MGVAYTSVYKTPLTYYWQALAVLIGVLCVLTGWAQAKEGGRLVRLVWTQVLHWAAFVGAINLLLYPMFSKC